MSTLSYQQSLSEVLTEADRRCTISMAEVPAPSLQSLQGKPQESLVLQVYGITPASREFKERLHGTIQRKLEATTLDILCGQYSRNQHLKLTLEDITFLQPDFRKPSLTFHLPLPDWLSQGYREAFFFYFLQTLSTFTLYPSYLSADSKEHYQFQAHMELQHAYLVDGLNNEATSDHVLLYIRPQTKGRGIAVLCVALADSTGRVVGPLPGHMMPLKFEEEDLARLQEECAVNENSVFTGSHSIKLHVWEKGNIGIEEFMHRLSVSYKQTMCDYFLEVYLLSSPMAQLVPTEDEAMYPDPTIEVIEEEAERGTAEVEESSAQPMTADVQVTRKKVSVVSLDIHTSNLSRRSSESLSRRVSEDLSRRGSENQSRRGSENISSESSSRRGSDNLFRRGSDNPSVLASGRGSLSSARKLSLIYSESRRASADQRVSVQLDKVSQALTHWRQDQIGQLHNQVIDETDEAERLLDTPISSPIPGGQGEAGNEGVKGGGESQLAWLTREKKRRTMKAKQALMRDAGQGKCGVLTPVYSVILPGHLSRAQQAACPSVRHLCLPLLGHHSTRVFVSQALSTLAHILPDLTASVFQLTPSGYTHYVPEKDWTQVKKKTDQSLQESSFIIIDRNIAQWEECLHGGQTSPNEPPNNSSTTQHFSSLGGKHTPSFTSPSIRRTPLQSLATTKDMLVPRRRMVFLRVTHHQGEVWLYNVCDQAVKHVCEQLSCVREWLACRSGLLHHLLAQKMGLFQHCQGPAIQTYANLAFKKSSTIPNVVKLIKSNVPVEESAKRPGFGASPHNYLVSTEHISIDTIYQEQRAYGSIASSQDPVFNHGRQFRDWHTHHRKQLETEDLLGRVFVSWQGRGGGASVPVNSTIIDNLKRMARLLHYCTSPLLVHHHKTTSTWTEDMQKEVLTLYLKYLNSLGFQAINERTSSKRKTASLKPSTSSQLYKCVQRSWPEGIIMVEVMFQELNFVVKLYTLERSRLQQGVEFSASFSKECARYKDFIHVHSFIHDFHLRLLLDILCKTRLPPYALDLRHFIALCHAHSSPPPHYVKNLLAKGVVHVPASVEPHLLYRHLIAHCKTFGATALELQVGGAGGVASHYRDEEVGLLIDVCGESLGPTTSPQLSYLMQNIESGYSIKVLALYSRHEPSSDKVYYLDLMFYLLLVNKGDVFPQLTLSSPCLSASCHPLPAHTPHTEPGTHESDLHLKVREHRRKMGFGSLATPSAACEQMLDQDKVEQQLHSVQTHLEGIVREGLHHMRKNELWKRMLYGSSNTGPDSRPAVLVDLSYHDFRDLLYMVTEYPLEVLDPRLTPLKKQPRKWFKKLIEPLKMRFAENVHIYCSDNGSHTYAAIVNPDWQDMFVLVHCDSETHRQGLSAVYRKAEEGGGVPDKERLITAHLEADRQHIETVVNFCCSFMWATILDAAPPPPTLHLL